MNHSQIAPNLENTIEYGESLTLPSSYSWTSSDDDGLPTERSKLLSRWGRVQQYVDSGDFLVPKKQNPNFSTANTTPGSKDETPKASSSDFFQERRLTLTQCLLMVALYLALAVLIYTVWLDRMSVIDAIYFAVITFTTVGYGELVPQSVTARLFTCGFAVLGVAGLGVVLGVLGNHLVEAQHNAIAQAKAVSQKRVLQLFHQNHSSSPPLSPKKEPNYGFRIPTLATTTLSQVVVEFVGLATLLCSFAVLEATNHVACEEHACADDFFTRWANALYFAVMTSTTIGFGDFVPATETSRVMACLLIPAAVAATGHWMAMVATHMVEVQQRRPQADAQELTMEHLDVMDQDGDGEVTQLEFLQFMLLAMNKVDRETLKLLSDTFARLDVDQTGVLDKKDLIHMAKRKLKGTRRKLELASYKNHVMKLGQCHSDSV